MGFQASAVLATPPPTAELDRLGDEIAELSAHLDAATARLLALIREFDARGGWNTGFRSCAEWLAWRVGLDMGAARERVRVAHALGTLPRLADGPGRRESSPTPRCGRSPAWPHRRPRRASSRWAARERPPMSSASCAAGGRWIAGPRRARPPASTKAAGSRSMRTTTAWWWCRVGSRRRRARSCGARWRRGARRSIRRRGGPRRGCRRSRWRQPPTVAQQQADALVLVAESALHHALDPGAPGERYQVVVHVDAPVLADPAQPGESALEDGAGVSAETSRRLTCDASRTVMRHEKRGHVVAIGARTRTIPPALRRALQHRDRGCRFPGCGVRVAEGHHLHHWAQGGPTTLSNLALLCRRHHRAVHEEGYQVARGPDGTLQFRRPDGRPLPEVPLSPAMVGDPVTSSGRVTTPRVFASMRTRPAPTGSVSAWSWAGRSTSCTPKRIA